MPRMDRTGPNGQGPMTGRGLGDCSQANTGSYGMGMGRGMGRGIGRVGFGRRGMGRGMGFGYGIRGGFADYYTEESYNMTDKEMLAKEKELLQNRLNIINKQMDEDSTSEK